MEKGGCLSDTMRAMEVMVLFKLHLISKHLKITPIPQIRRLTFRGMNVASRSTCTCRSFLISFLPSFSLLSTKMTPRRGSQLKLSVCLSYLTFALGPTS